MISIFEVTDWAHVASFLVWTLAVCALAKAIFGSFLAAELQYRLALHRAPRGQRLSRLTWEVAKRAKWDEAVARGSPHAVAVPLTEPELEARRTELRKVSGASLPWRALNYFLGCWACQTFWAALVMYWLAGSMLDWRDWVFTAAAYSGAAVLVGRLHGIVPVAAPGRGATQSGCKHCGK